MSRSLYVAGLLTLPVLAGVVWFSGRNPDGTVVPFEPPSRLLEPAPLCPWREPESDLPRFFPEADRFETVTRILSGLRPELTEALGRPPEPDEITLTVHRAYAGSHPVGSVLARRVKGRYGGIEIVLAVDEAGRVRDLRLQRQREPFEVASALQDADWLAAFRNRAHDRGWDIDDLKAVPVDARDSALAVREGVRALLVLLAASEAGVVPAAAKPHH